MHSLKAVRKYITVELFGAKMLAPLNAGLASAEHQSFVARLAAAK
jgi:hypothetical protein